ncbi:MAG: 30S ribosomal protein S3 [Candidatus Pacebacteria bacterium CG_4_10_14_3_um_filter_34_15]|nr:30S ribosomal protein S3 [Candidatus Pacearchaeota archaeon]NCQ65252.1 30S ribosomal protein S3 [Candidatus Paceibacterota bacterium]OIO45021.1 MAG: 30S ribosomal protein S3 [Candidatus Pacebacteria bacterium CG1_02_43_31]PIQ81031.1 MAG: 30S ribosomal protein S3 [Candidatus Pacebacteria bacterium CG11_big_fil_rev_8_21_14_0_20_34_55]PIX81848.1 MAG: 30S ribosomal protein S3 [Candidatus Pacebacteria bacterium CG_4_10_14_3_um_filter_34_15]PJC44063.1 MAG: 30S ribosomal protein S3 [Candidatus Pac
MGQKVHPTGFRIGSTFSWKSRWFADPKDYSDRVIEDYKVRKFLNDKLISAGVTNVEIERSLKAIKVVLFVSRPGVVIGKGGTNLEVIKKEIERILNVSKLQKDKVKIDLRVEEVRKPDLSSKLVAERIVAQLIKRFPHRRAVMQALEKTMQAGAKGIKIQLSGRINGAEIGRTEKYFQGSVPTQTIRANIDYFQVPARTRSGYVGIKVWIYKGEVV